VHLAVLWSFAVAQPLFDLLGGAPEFFVARGNTSGDIVLLSIALVLVPPLVLVAVEALLELVSGGLRRAFHLLVVALLAAGFVLQVIQEISAPAGLLIGVTLVAGALFALAYRRTRAAPALLSVLGPAPLVFLLLFLFVSPVSKLVLPGERREAASVDVPGSPAIVMIVFDEFAGYVLQNRAGGIDAARFPNFARLGRDATWYRNASTVADFTDRAVPALLTGEMPDKGALPIAADHPESLFTLFGGRYSLDVTEPVTDICPPELCPEATRGRQIDRLTRLVDDLSLVSLHLLLPETLGEELPPVDRSFGDFRGANVAQPAKRAPPTTGLVRGALQALSNRDQTFDAFERRLAHTPRRGRLTFFHIELPHSPYEFLPSGQRYPEPGEEVPGIVSRDGGPSGGAWSRDAALSRQGLERYILQAAYADRLLGRALDRLHSRGLYERALVVVASDHGSSYTPGTPHRAASAANLPEIASVPLFIKSPGQRRGEIDDSNVQTIDVLPTVAHRLGVELPWQVQGKPAARASRDGRIELQPHYSGDDFTIPFADFVRRRDDLVRRLHASLGDDWASLFQAKLDANLAGARIGELSTAQLTGASLELDHAGLLSRVDPAGPIVPSLVTGSISGVPDGVRLALVVDGQVVAPAVRFRDSGGERFSAVVPPQAFSRGENSVELLGVTKSGTLARLSPSAVGWRLVRRGDRELIVGAGVARPIDAAGNGGFLDQVRTDGHQVQISGWAGEGVRDRPADRVLAFDGGRLLDSTVPSIERPDVAASRGRQLLRSGFILNGLMTGPTAGSARAHLRVFALFGRRAVPVPRAP
jgi:hypothetical protein